MNQLRLASRFLLASSIVVLLACGFGDRTSEIFVENQTEGRITAQLDLGSSRSQPKVAIDKGARVSIGYSFRPVNAGTKVRIRDGKGTERVEQIASIHSVDEGYLVVIKAVEPKLVKSARPPLRIEIENPQKVMGSPSHFRGIEYDPKTQSYQVVQGVSVASFNVHSPRSVSCVVTLHMDQPLGNPKDEEWYVSINKEGKITHSPVACDQKSR